MCFVVHSFTNLFLFISFEALKVESGVLIQMVFQNGCLSSFSFTVCVIEVLSWQRNIMRTNWMGKSYWTRSYTFQNLIVFLCSEWHFCSSEMLMVVTLVFWSLKLNLEAVLYIYIFCFYYKFDVLWIFGHQVKKYSVLRATHGTSYHHFLGWYHITLSVVICPFDVEKYV